MSGPTKGPGRPNMIQDSGHGMCSPSAILEKSRSLIPIAPSLNIGIVKALTDKKDQVYGVVGIDITLVNLTSYIENVEVAHKGYMMLLDHNGTILASREKETLFKNIRDLYGSGLQEVFQTRQGYSILSDRARENYFTK